jgi:AcrR family transcriptional regulator
MSKGKKHILDRLACGVLGSPSFRVWARQESEYEQSSDMPTRISAHRTGAARSGKPAEPIRRSPLQERARQTVEAIFEASARILEQDGLEAANTNSIAERAGISIGTLYQYFPNKDAIFIAMARRELERDREVMQRAVAESTDSSAYGLARATVHALIGLHRSRYRVRRLVMRVHLAHGLSAEHDLPVQTVAQQIESKRRARAGADDQQLGALRLFVITRAILGTIRAAMLEQPELLDTPQFEEELVFLAVRYLDRQAGASNQ